MAKCVITVDCNVWGNEKEVRVEGRELKLVAPGKGSEFDEYSIEQVRMLEAAREKWAGRMIGVVDA